MSPSRILILGSSTIDTKGHAEASILPGPPSPADIHLSVSGVVCNTAKNLDDRGSV